MVVVQHQNQDVGNGLLIDENTCPNCGIPVYQAEALLAGKMAFKMAGNLI